MRLLVAALVKSTITSTRSCSRSERNPSAVAERVDLDRWTSPTPPPIVDYLRPPAADERRGPDSQLTTPTAWFEFRRARQPAAGDQSSSRPRYREPHPPASSKTRSFDFDKSPRWAVGDQRPYLHVISFQVRQNATETWNIERPQPGLEPSVHHPLSRFGIVNRNAARARPRARPQGRFQRRATFTDPQGQDQFRDFLGTNPMHCHKRSTRTTMMLRIYILAARGFSVEEGHHMNDAHSSSPRALASWLRSPPADGAGVPGAAARTPISGGAGHFQNVALLTHTTGRSTSYAEDKTVITTSCTRQCRDGFYHPPWPTWRCSRSPERTAARRLHVLDHARSQARHTAVL